jgi:DNA polymerase-3 subunit alpha
MKVHHPVEFLAATLTASSGSSDDVVKYVNTCREAKIPVLPPDVNKSELSFTPDGGAIRFGLGAVKGVGEGAVASVLDARRGEGPFRSLTDFCSRVDLRLNNRRVIEALVKSGCFDSLGKSRAALLDGLDMAIDVAAAAREAANSTQSLLFDVPKDAQFEDRFEDKPEWNADERIRFEKETLGFYITGHPLARFEDEIRMFGDATCETLHERLDAPVKLVGLVSSIKKNQIKKGQNEGKMMAKAVVEDLTGTVAVTVFASLLERIAGWFAPGKPVLVTGTVRSSMQIGAGAASSEHEGESASMPIEVIAREIQPLEGMKEQGARHVLVAPSNFDTFDEKSLGEILRRFPGSTPVFLEMRRTGQFAAPLKLSSEFWVRPTPEFTASMEALLGPGSVRYGYASSA